MAKFCSPLTEDSPSKISSTEDFIRKLNQYNPSTSTMYTIDVVSLFPSVPLFEAQMLLVKLLNNKFELSKNTIVNLYETFFYIRQYAAFQVNGKFYQQTEGLPMGSPLSPLLAEVYMQHIEQLLVFPNDKRPILWTRYVDDIFVLWSYPEIELQNLLNKITATFPTIKFTINQEKDNQINFLDVQIEKRNERFLTSVFHKTTGNPALIPYNSFSYGPHKKAAFQYYLNRASKICNNPEAYEEEIVFIKELAYKHGFPIKFVDRMIQKTQGGSEITLVPTDGKKPKFVGSFVFNKYAYQIAKLFSRYNYKIAFKPVQSVFEMLRRDRDPIAGILKSGIYKIPIEDQNEIMSTYIGSSCRKIETRIKEHQNDVKRLRESTENTDRTFQNETALIQYLKQNPELTPNWQNTRKIASGTNNFRIRYRESLEIITHKCCNLETPIYVPIIWRAILANSVALPMQINNQNGNLGPKTGFTADIDKAHHTRIQRTADDVGRSPTKVLL